MNNHTSERRAEILSMRSSGETYKSIAAKFGLSIGRVRQIILFGDPTKPTPSQLRRASGNRTGISS